jgi:hypothetical protein
MLGKPCLVGHGAVRLHQLNIFSDGKLPRCERATIEYTPGFFFAVIFFEQLVQQIRRLLTFCCVFEILNIEGEWMPGSEGNRSSWPPIYATSPATCVSQRVRAAAFSAA